MKAGVNIIEGDKIRFADAGEKDSKDRWIFWVEVISGKTGRVRASKKFSLNKTNFLAISSLYGTNSDDWIGKEVEVHVALVQDPTGKSVKGVRIIGREEMEGFSNIENMSEDVMEKTETPS